jgi:hypothetical protein
MLISPVNIRENGQRAAAYLALAAQSMAAAVNESKTSPGKGRTNALLKAAECHAEAVKNLGGAIELIRELY